MRQITKHVALLAGGAGPMPVPASIHTSGQVVVGSTLTTLGGTYVVTEVNDGAALGSNRHQRRAAAAKRRKGDAR